MSTGGPITIETARLLLRPMRPEDHADLLGIFGDPKVMAAFGIGPFGDADMRRWLARNLDHQARHGYGLFSVIHKADGLFIGDCGLELRDVGGAVEAELGYDFRSDHWNQGFATEAARTIRDYAFRDLTLQRLISLVRAGNAASARVAEKVGMSRIEDLQEGEVRYWVYALARPLNT